MFFFPPPPGAGGLAPWQTQTQPNTADLYTFLTTVAGVPTAALPSNSPYLAWALSFSEENTLLVLRAVGQDYYCFAVYLLATSFLINWAPDQLGQTFFADLRNTWNISGFVGGIVQSTADQGTSESMTMPDFLNGLTLGQLQALKDPFGRQWLAMSQELGPIWGIS
ncbi:hypothetical protein BGLT_02255 [Caballeronia glathei]|uniref:Uncharacterized protein n=1 Tax=Caballeronia glathei TaxID=60547 RepID=A0A069PW15_9BURK|nr:hypothetical protein [Caballeronia glathei]KDR41546.1 hypothetical protein BG61_16760 [Caballeronia glathei]CDY79474.1 hypothetical protein BGLT_02255 [Caballeronia glathei]